MLHQVSNFLEPEVLDAIRQKFADSHGRDVFEVNNMGRWGAGLEAGSYSPVLVLKLEEYRDYFIQKYKTVDPAFAEFNNVIVYMHIWLPGSQINWHHDSNDEAPRLSSTIYINPSWNWNWGGLFLYDDPGLGQRWVFPHENHMVWFRPPVWHSTTMVTQSAEYPRLSIQLFFTP
jgi:hypothetical protein